jgi:hypothetical protein
MSWGAASGNCGASADEAIAATRRGIGGVGIPASVGHDASGRRLGHDAAVRWWLFVMG